LVIAKRYCPVADYLAGFKALAGDQENIASAQIGNRCPRLPHAGRRFPAAQGRRDGGADGGWLFAARIIVSDVTRSPGGGDSPINGRLPRSRSPPAPKTTTSLPLAAGRNASRAL
jgi:hypothetical protein